MPVTSHDVARYAGVSQSTVSRALRGEPGISATTIARVRAAADALAYVPSESGRSLSTRRTRRIGVVTAELTNPFYPELVEPIRGALELAGYQMLLILDSPEAPLTDVEGLASGRLDGVIVTTARHGSQFPAVLARHAVPFVFVNRDIAGVAADACTIDNVRGGALAAELLAGLGHRHVAAIFGPEDTSTSRDRELGFRGELNDRGVTLRSTNVRRGPFSYETGHTATLDLLAESTGRPTAIFCGNDVVALGAINAAATLGLRSGTDVTVVGFDDIAMASWDLFSLTTIRCDLAAMARHAVDLVISRIEDPALPNQRVVLTPELVLRSSHHEP